MLLFCLCCCSSSSRTQNTPPTIPVHFFSLLQEMLPLLRLAALLTVSSLTVPAAGQDYLKLDLLHPTPPVSLHQAILLDSLRLSSLSASPVALASPLVSGASAGSGQYFVRFRAGTPPQSLLLVADTGSDLVWVRCSACRANCSLRHRPGTAFFPRLSSTFSPFHCYDPSCRLVPPDPTASRLPCNRSTPVHTPCRYHYSYSDRSSSSGFFSRDHAVVNATSGGQIRLPPLSFGCAFNTSGPAFASGSAANGVMGLGRGPTSFPSQLGKRFGSKFSYCLKDYTIAPPPTSYLLIGDAPAVEGSDFRQRRGHHLVYTPLLDNALSPTFYYIGIEGVTVDGVPLPIDPSVFALDPDTGVGGTVIDSGTTLSFLPEAAYRQILAAMEKRLRLPRVAVGGAAGTGGDTGPGTPAFDLCVNATGLGGKQLPRLALRMEGGAVLSPPPRNYFIEAAEGVKCLALQPTAPGRGGFGVVGNLMQQGYLFVFDRDRNRLGFSRTGCAA